MSTIRLRAPPDFVSTAKINTVHISPAELVRLSLRTDGEPFFHHSGANRFDAPGAPLSPQFSTCYFGLDLPVAIAETVLRNQIPGKDGFSLPRRTLESFHTLRFDGADLHLADLTGASFKRLSGNADLAASDIYDITQQWSLAVFNNPATVDGIMYMSRHLNTNRAVALYDRASPKIYLRCASTLFAEPGYADIVRMFGIQAI